jgi:PKD repeat protein
VLSIYCDSSQRSRALNAYAVKCQRSKKLQATPLNNSTNSKQTELIMKNILKIASKSIIPMICLFLSVTMISSCGEDDEMPVIPTPDPSSVVASFTSQVDADNSLTYSFTNNSVVNGITNTSFTSSWDFGGDGVSSEASPTYTFTTEGTFEVTLTVTATDGEIGTTSSTIEVTAPKNRYAVIADLADDDTGELRYQAMDSIRTGRVTFMYRVFEDAADGFINVSGPSTTGDFALVEVRIKDNAPHEFREGASDAAVASANFPEGVINEWVPVEISWAASADGLTPPTFSVSMNGQVVISDALSTTNGGADDVPGHLEATKDGGYNFQWKYNSTSSTSEGVYQVDDIVIYSSDSGTEVVAFSDDFQGYTAGDDLDPADADGTVRNANSVYHPNCSEVTVGEDQ